MDHDDVLEQLDLAAVEPGGLDRLTAGDTPTAAAVVAHLAGCADCSSAYERIRTAAPLLRDIVRTMPPADLRARTLDHVRMFGVARGGGAVSAPMGSPVAHPVATTHDLLPAVAGTASDGLTARSRPRRAAIGWPVAMAAAVVLAFGAGTLAARPDATQFADQAQQLRGLGRITMATLALTAERDVRRVALAATAPGASTAGTLLFSPSTTRLVVVAEGLPRPADGREYRCWMDRDGTREDVGRMFFAGDLAFWVGATPGVAAAAPGTTFGVSLTEVGGASLASDPVIAGGL